MLKIKERIQLVSVIACMAALCSCSIEIPPFYSESSSGDEYAVTATTSRTERDRATTTTKRYVAEGGKEYTTTKRSENAEEIDPDSMDRVSVSVNTRKIEGKDISLTTTTTAKKSEYDTLQKPKNNEYFDITKQYRTSKATQLRFGPSGDYTTQKEMPAGTSLSCYGKSGKWYYALYDNTTYGWVEESALEGIAKKTTTKKK